MFGPAHTHACTHPRTRMHPHAHMQLLAHTESVCCFTLRWLWNKCKSFTGHLYFHVCFCLRSFQATLNPHGRRAGKCKCLLRRQISLWLSKLHYVRASVVYRCQEKQEEPKPKRKKPITTTPNKPDILNAHNNGLVSSQAAGLEAHGSWVARPGFLATAELLLDRSFFHWNISVLPLR